MLQFEIGAFTRSSIRTADKTETTSLISPYSMLYLPLGCGFRWLRERTRNPGWRRVAQAQGLENLYDIFGFGANLVFQKVKKNNPLATALSTSTDAVIQNYL